MVGWVPAFAGKTDWVQSELQVTRLGTWGSPIEEILSPIPTSDVQIRRASLMHLETIIGFNAAMAMETEGRNWTLTCSGPESRRRSPATTWAST